MPFHPDRPHGPLKRRQVIAALGLAAAFWPRRGRAQPRSLPVIGYLGPTVMRDQPSLFAAFWRALGESGFSEGSNVAISEKAAQGDYARLPALAAELARQDVDAIFAGAGIASARAAQSATRTIPIVFVGSGDPVADGLVASLARPGANITGVTFVSGALGPKRLEFLHELVPDAALAMLVNPRFATSLAEARDLEAAAQVLGRPLRRLEASDAAQLEAALTSGLGPKSALLVTSDPFFNVSRRQLAALAVRLRLPIMYYDRIFVDEGGLISYGTSLAEAFHQAGRYIARILKGDKPAELPVVQVDKFELVINLKAANAIGLTVPTKLLVAADAVIE